MELESYEIEEFKKKAILDLLEENPKITTQQIADELGMSRVTAIKFMKKHNIKTNDPRGRYKR